MLAHLNTGCTLVDQTYDDVTAVVSEGVARKRHGTQIQPVNVCRAHRCFWLRLSLKQEVAEGGGCNPAATHQKNTCVYIFPAERYL